MQRPRIVTRRRRLGAASQALFTAQKKQNALYLHAVLLKICAVY